MTVAATAVVYCEPLTNGVLWAPHASTNAHPAKEDALAAVLYRPAAQAVHAETAEALLRVLYVPVGHGDLTGLAGPVMRPPEQYDPGAHAEQPAAGPLM